MVCERGGDAQIDVPSSGCAALRRGVAQSPDSSHYRATAFSGSAFIFASTFSAVFISNFFGVSLGVRSLHFSGIDTVAVGVARSTYGGTVCLPLAFCMAST